MTIRTSRYLGWRLLALMVCVGGVIALVNGYLYGAIAAPAGAWFLYDIGHWPNR